MEAATPTFTALRSGSVVLHLITDENLGVVRGRFSELPDAGDVLAELNRHYAPRFDDSGRRTLWGFYAVLGNNLAGLSLLGISSWEHRRGFIGADTLMYMRGRGVAPGAKPQLFYLGFALLGLNRIETGCSPLNAASRRSIEKTAGFKLEGVLREHNRREDGVFEDDLRYAILRRDWEQLYDPNAVEVIK